MHSTTLLIVIVVVVAALIVIGLIAAFMRRSRLHELPDESKARYAQQWREVEARFIEDPRGAMRDADGLAVSILRERGETMDDQHVPKDLREAREAARTEGGGQPGTEPMRRAMLGYQHTVADGLGGVAMRKYADRGENKREVA